MSAGSTPPAGSFGFYASALLACCGLSWLSFHDLTSYGFTDIDALLYVREAGRFELTEPLALFGERLTGGRAGDTANFYRPLVGALYAGLRALFGWNPAGYHAAAILLHAANGFLVASLARGVAASTGVARANAFGLLSGALFVIHPLALEVVPAVARYADLLVTALFIASLLALLRADRATDRAAGRGALAVFYALFACTLLSKETGAVLLGAAPLMLICCGSGPGFRERLRRAIAVSLPCLVLLLGFAALRASVLGEWLGGYSSISRTPLERLERVLAGLPVDLCVPAFAHRLREWGEAGGTAGLAFFVVAVLLAFAFGGWRRYRSRASPPGWARVLAFVFGVVVLHATVLGVTGVYHRRYLYPVVAFACWLPALACVTRASTRFGRVGRVVAFAWVGLVAAQSPLAAPEIEWRSAGLATFLATEGARESWQQVPDGAHVQLVNLPALMSLDPARLDLFFPGSSSNGPTWYAIEAWLEDAYPDKRIRLSQLGLNVYTEPVASFRHEARIIDGWAVFRLPNTRNAPGLGPVMGDVGTAVEPRDPGLSRLETLTLDASHRAIAYPQARAAGSQEPTFLLIFDGESPRLFSAAELANPGPRPRLRRSFQRGEMRATPRPRPSGIPARR